MVPETVLGGPQSPTSFHNNSKPLFVRVTLSHEYTAEFSRRYVTRDDILVLTANVLVQNHAFPFSNVNFEYNNHL